jgi:hypothetical protein
MLFSQNMQAEMCHTYLLSKDSALILAKVGAQDGEDGLLLSGKSK